MRGKNNEGGTKKLTNDVWRAKSHLARLTRGPRTNSFGTQKLPRDKSSANCSTARPTIASRGGGKEKGRCGECEKKGKIGPNKRPKRGETRVERTGE